MQEAGETASAFLVRLLKVEVEVGDYRLSAKRMHDKMFGSARGLFDQVRKSTSALGSTLSAYEELTKLAKPTPFEIHPIRTDHFSGLNDLLAEQARERAKERAEEMELTRLTGQMAVLSGYPSDLYEQHLPDWSCILRLARAAGSPRPRTEALWLSPSAAKLLKSK